VINTIIKEDDLGQLKWNRFKWKTTNPDQPIFETTKAIPVIQVGPGKEVFKFKAYVRFTEDSSGFINHLEGAELSVESFL